MVVISRVSILPEGFDLEGKVTFGFDTPILANPLV